MSFTIVKKYTLFAVISSCVNILIQHLFLSMYSGIFSLYLAMSFGVISGLGIKYYLDKRFIFYFETETKTEGLTNFIRYSFMGVFTTLLFFAFEVSFDFFIKKDYSKYIGAAIGLILSYYVKYRLDKKFVFKK